LTRVLSHLLATRGRNVGAAVSAALLLAACGSSSASPSGANPSPAAGNGVGSKSPAQIIAAAQAALRSTTGFVVAGTLSQGREAAQLRIVDDGPSRLQMRISQGGKFAEIIALQNAGYVRGNQAFWTAQLGPTAAGLANSWIEVAASDTKQLASSFGVFAPSTLARCLGEDLGTLSRDGATTVDGHPAVVVGEAGNVPGSSPGTLAVATSGPAYPLRITSTGPTRLGGTVDVCNDGKGGGTEGTLTLSEFDHAPPIAVPKHPLKGGGPTSSV
jgi:hypothetical protein